MAYNLVIDKVSVPILLFGFGNGFNLLDLIIISLVKFYQQKAQSRLIGLIRNFSILIVSNWRLIIQLNTSG